MDKLLTENNFNLLSSLLTLGAAALITKGIDKVFEARTGNAPPKNPEKEDTSSREVILYTAVTAAATVAAQILLRKLLTDLWRKHDGELPEQLQ